MANRTDYPLDSPGECGNTFAPRIWKGDQATISTRLSLSIRDSLFYLSPTSPDVGMKGVKVWGLSTPSM